MLGNEERVGRQGLDGRLWGCVGEPKFCSPCLLAVRFFTNEQQETMLMVGSVLVDGSQFIGFHSQITLGAPYRLFRTHSNLLVLSLGVISFPDRFLSITSGSKRGFEDSPRRRYVNH